MIPRKKKVHPESITYMSEIWYIHEQVIFEGNTYMLASGIYMNRPSLHILRFDAQLFAANLSM
jgi:hypothetical protein